MFSVIIPTYNRAHSIPDTLESIYQQSYRPIEIIVIDDGSGDNTEQIVTEWSHNNCSDGSQQLSLKYIHQKNSGAASARNKGLRHATGSYIQFLDSDDRLHPGRFEILAKAFELEGADFIQTSIDWFDPQTGKTVHTLRARPWANQVHLVMQGDFWANTLRGALSMDLARRIGPWEETMTCFEDREYMERAVLSARNPIALDPVLGYLARGEGMHVSNKHTTYEGRKWRIFSEAKLVDLVNQRSDISNQWKSELASRIYRIGCRSNASGWYHYGKECADIADRLNAQRTIQSHIKRLLSITGPLGAVSYRMINRIKSSRGSA